MLTAKQVKIIESIECAAINLRYAVADLGKVKGVEKVEVAAVTIMYLIDKLRGGSGGGGKASGRDRNVAKSSDRAGEIAA